MKLLHLTDTHYLRENQINQVHPILQDVFEKQLNFKEKIALLSRQESLESFDMVVVTGDLVHENKADHYRELLDLMKETFGDTPVFYTLGNHDIKNEFHLANSNENKESYFDYSIEFQGKHFIFLDSAMSGESLGSFTFEQLNWLDNELKQNTLPKVVFMHHPLFGGADYQKYIVTENEAAINILSQHDILGIFSGHTHQPAINHYKGMLQSTSYCFAFGINHVDVDTYMEFNNLTGYTVIDIEEELSIQPRLLSPAPSSIVKIKRSDV